MHKRYPPVGKPYYSIPTKMSALGFPQDKLADTYINFRNFNYKCAFSKEMNKKSWRTVPFSNFCSFIGETKISRKLFCA